MAIGLFQLGVLRYVSGNRFIIYSIRNLIAVAHTSAAVNPRAISNGRPQMSQTPIAEWGLNVFPHVLFISSIFKLHLNVSFFFSGQENDADVSSSSSSPSNSPSRTSSPFSSDSPLRGMAEEEEDEEDEEEEEEERIPLQPSSGGHHPDEKARKRLKDTLQGSEDPG